jgi:hypothetical protein
VKRIKNRHKVGASREWIVREARNSLWALYLLLEELHAISEVYSQQPGVTSVEEDTNYTIKHLELDPAAIDMGQL